MEKQKASRGTYSVVAAISCPLLIHGDGYVDWSNQTFSDQFGIRPSAVKRLKTRELLWCLGIGDPLAGMIAEGIVFDNWEVPPLNLGLTPLYLRHIRLQSDNEDCERFMLLISDQPDLDDGVLSSPTALC